MLNRAKDYYDNDKERLREQAKIKYRNLSEEEKNKREYGKDRYLKKKTKRISKKIIARQKKSQYNNSFLIVILIVILKIF